jgi:16S rRNA (uracil1498-N3)-methyltransferase
VTANQFFVPLIPEGAARIVLRDDEHRHLAKAARVKAGEEIWLFDGRGRRSRARVEKVGPDSTEVVVLAVEASGRPRTTIVLAPCLVEAKKLETVIEKAAELGCSEIRPVVSARSYKAAGERSDRKLERWRRIVREAAKQCKAALLTEVHPPRPLKELLGEAGPARRLFLSEHGGRPLKDVLGEGPGSGAGAPARVILLVGPKGGWTAGEEETIRRAGFEAVSLGDRILRAETASLAGAAMIAHFWNE